jgi:hypothetical protein
MKNKTRLTTSLHLHAPEFDCYKTVNTKYKNIRPENSPPIHRLFSSKCNSKNECFAVECPV